MFTPLDLMMRCFFYGHSGILSSKYATMPIFVTISFKPGIVTVERIYEDLYGKKDALPLSRAPMIFI